MGSTIVIIVLLTFHSPGLPSTYVDVVIIHPTIPHPILTLFMTFSVTYYTLRYAMLNLVSKSVSSYPVKYVVYILLIAKCHGFHRCPS